MTAHAEFVAVLRGLLEEHEECFDQVHGDARNCSLYGDLQQAIAEWEENDAEERQ